MMLFLLFFLLQQFQPVARIHYSGGGDWYGNKTTWQNIFRLYEKTFSTKLPLKEEKIKLTDSKRETFPMLYLSGHGNVKFSESEIKNLRLYLLNGGFLYIDDDFGIDKSIRRELKKIFPKKNFVEIPKSHEIFSFPYKFENGLPKIHEHSGGAPRAFALFHKKRIIVFYTFNTDISDGCEDKVIHGHSDKVRLKALKMGVNILSYGINH